MLNSDIGFMMPILENNNFCNYICHTVKEFINHNKKFNCCIFNQYCELVDTKNVPLLPMSHARYFDGNLLVLDMASLLLSINFPKTKNIYFYTNITPWTSSYNNYNEWQKIFGKKNLKIISNSNHIHDIYNIVWNNSVGVVENMTYETLSKYIY
jgi:hypothetical protein